VTKTGFDRQLCDRLFLDLGDKNTHFVRLIKFFIDKSFFLRIIDKKKSRQCNLHMGKCLIRTPILTKNFQFEILQHKAQFSKIKFLRKFGRVGFF
jgi:hypothetical protein